MTKCSKWIPKHGCVLQLKLNMKMKLSFLLLPTTEAFVYFLFSTVFLVWYFTIPFSLWNNMICFAIPMNCVTVIWILFFLFWDMPALLKNNQQTIGFGKLEIWKKIYWNIFILEIHLLDFYIFRYNWIQLWNEIIFHTKLKHNLENIRMNYVGMGSCIIALDSDNFTYSKEIHRMFQFNPASKFHQKRSLGFFPSDLF